MDLANQPGSTNPKAEAEPRRGHSNSARARRGERAEAPDITIVSAAAHPDFGGFERRGAEEKIFTSKATMYMKTKHRLT